MSNLKRKNMNNKKDVWSVKPSIKSGKVLVTYTNGTSEEMLKSKSDQIIRSVK